MILLAGRYSGLIQPAEHYVELKKDFSNVDDVLRQVENIPALQAMAERAYHHLIGSGAHSYRRFIELVDGVIERKLLQRADGVAPSPVANRITRARVRGRLMTTDLPTTFPLDSSHLAGEQVRRALARLPGWRRGWIPARLREDPDGFAKALVSMRAISVYPLRALFLPWLADRKIRRRIGYEGLVTDLFKLEIVRQASRATLRARERFFIRCGFDSATGVLALTSVPADDARMADTGSEAISEMSAALRQGRVTSMIWDHSALGWQVVWERERSQRLTVFVGVGGVHRFDALMELAQCRPDRVAEILTVILGGEDVRCPGAPTRLSG